MNRNEFIESSQCPLTRKQTQQCMKILDLKIQRRIQCVGGGGSSKGGSRGLRSQDPPCWGTPNIHIKEENNVVCMRANSFHYCLTVTRNSPILKSWIFCCILSLDMQWKISFNKGIVRIGGGKGDRVIERRVGQISSPLREATNTIRSQINAPNEIIDFTPIYSKP